MGNKIWCADQERSRLSHISHSVYCVPVISPFCEPFFIYKPGFHNGNSLRPTVFGPGPIPILDLRGRGVLLDVVAVLGRSTTPNRTEFTNYNQLSQQNIERKLYQTTNGKCWTEACTIAVWCGEKEKEKFEHPSNNNIQKNSTQRLWIQIRNDGNVDVIL